MNIVDESSVCLVLSSDTVNASEASRISISHGVMASTAGQRCSSWSGGVGTRKRCDKDEEVAGGG